MKVPYVGPWGAWPGDLEVDQEELNAATQMTMTAKDCVAQWAKRSVMSRRFLVFAEWLLDRETVFQPGHFGDYRFAMAEKVKGDAGGTTKFGIDQRSHRSVKIEDLTPNDALDIYESSYWVPSLAPICPPGYGEIVCDVKVNGGRSWLIVQRGLNRLKAGLVQDGLFGRKTLQAMKTIGHEGLSAVLDEREAYYHRLAENPRMTKFLQGWVNRNNSLRGLIGA